MNRPVSGCMRQAGQRGQVLALGLPLLGVLAAVLVVLHGLGRTVEARARLTHAADAAAYSGALAQARQLNFLAYANRAQIAHQIAMAHLVTLGASLAFADTLAGQRRRNNPPGHLLASLFGRDVGQAYRAARADLPAQRDLARLYAEHERVAHAVLAAGSAAAVAGLPAERERLMRAVLRDNYAGEAAASQPVPRLLHDGWPGYVRRRTATRGVGVWSAVEQAAQRYGFLDRRDGTRHSAVPPNAQCPASPHALRRRGSTWLDAQGHWGALDTQSFHSSRWNRWAGCYYREYSMGWGAVLETDAKPPAEVEYAKDPPSDFTTLDFWRWVKQSTSWSLGAGVATPLANSYALAQGRRWPGQGVPDDYEVVNGALPLRFVLAVRQHLGAMARTPARGQPVAPEGSRGERRTITVTTAAETYFARPSGRAGDHDELATLFRPYWQARLSAEPAPRAPQSGEAP
ncbi:MAG: hypothetical protein ACN6O8_09290 [Achromobacter sp.]|uniref:hypothetical protein n=1 Tax=Achromobacter sp. TaxID=134375 RepID=UPI003D054F58